MRPRPQLCAASTTGNSKSAGSDESGQPKDECVGLGKELKELRMTISKSQNLQAYRRWTESHDAFPEFAEVLGAGDHLWRWRFRVGWTIRTQPGWDQSTGGFRPGCCSRRVGATSACEHRGCGPRMHAIHERLS